MIRTLFPALLLVASSAFAANESLVEIQWNAGNGFPHSAQLAPGKFLEVCGKLSQGQTVGWQFESEAELDFNIHYHQGKDVVFPAKLAKVKQGQDQLKVAFDQDYCWMWSNKGKAAAALKLHLQR